MTNCNNAKARCETPVEILLGRRVRLPVIAVFDLFCSKAKERTKIVPATLIIRKGLNTSFIQPENSSRIFLASNNQIAKLDEDKVESGPPVGDHISIRVQLQNTYWGSSNQDETSAATSIAEERQPKSLESVQDHQQDKEYNPSELENLYP